MTPAILETTVTRGARQFLVRENVEHLAILRRYRVQDARFNAKEVRA